MWADVLFTDVFAAAGEPLLMHLSPTGAARGDLYPSVAHASVEMHPGRALDAPDVGGTVRPERETSLRTLAETDTDVIAGNRRETGTANGLWANGL